MILANYAQQNRNSIKEWGVAFSNPFSQFKPTLFNNTNIPDTSDIALSRSGLNEGYNTSYSWSHPMRSGGMASTSQIEGVGSLTAAALAVKLAEAALSGSGDLEGIGSLIVQAIADLSGAGVISDANMQAFLLAVASLSGSGDLAGTRSALGALIAALSGDGDAETSTLTGLGELDADLVVTGSGLTTSNVGQAVWSALASANNSAGTMGEKLNDAGSASNPWTEVIESGYTAAEILRILVAVSAGKTNIAGTTVTFRDMGDSKDRVTAEMTGSERTTVTYDET